MAPMTNCGSRPFHFLVIFKILFGVIVVQCLIGGAASAQNNYSIGWIGALSGDAAGIGTEILASLKTAVAEVNSAGGINGRPLGILAQDDGYEISRALSAYHKLKSEVNTRLVFMSTYGALFALGKQPERDGVLIIDTLDCNDKLAAVSKNHLCVATRTESIAENFVKAIRSRGDGSVAVLYEEEAWFNFIVTGLKQAYGSKLTEVTAPVKSGDYQAELMRIKQSSARHLVLLGNDAMGRAVAQIKQMRLDLSLYSIASVTSPGFKQLAGPALNGTIVSHWAAGNTPAVEAFRSKFKEQNGREPALEFVAAPTYDAARLVFAGLRQLPKDNAPVDPKKLRAALLALPSFHGLCGNLKFDPDGAVRSINERLYVFQNGGLKEFP
jgi:branched-chain amino acid transport system substrate-binding protein